MKLTQDMLDPEQGIILPIDKPYKWTSADVIRKVKYAAIRYFGKKNLKVGHAGTLDPLATGILLVCIGKATKRAEELQCSPKEYIAGVTFGATTPSYDLEKEIDREFPHEGICPDSIEAVLPNFEGEQMQVAPLFSAKSVDGVRAYETARKLYKQAQRAGETIDLDSTGILQANPVNIYELELLNFKEGPCDSPKATDDYGRIHVADISSYNLPQAEIRVGCSKGTYIRAFARDLGEALGSGAFLHSLRRTKNGGFTIEDAISMDEVMELFRLQ